MTDHECVGAWCARLLWCLRCDSVLSAQQQAASDAQKSPSTTWFITVSFRNFAEVYRVQFGSDDTPKTFCRHQRTRKLIKLLSCIWDHSQRKWLISCFISTSALYKYSTVLWCVSERICMKYKIWWRKCVMISLDDAFTCTMTKKETANWE